MENKKYSKIYKFGNKNFRYNFNDCVLEWVSKIDFDENYNLIESKEWVVADCIGLSSKGWKENKQDYIEQYFYELEEEIASMI